MSWRGFGDYDVDPAWPTPGFLGTLALGLAGSLGIRRICVAWHRSGRATL